MALAEGRAAECGASAWKTLPAMRSAGRKVHRTFRFSGLKGLFSLSPEWLCSDQYLCRDSKESRGKSAEQDHGGQF
jgi:hypothetical protein